jgi:SAM-dependent methyltransferase
MPGAVLGRLRRAVQRHGLPGAVRAGTREILDRVLSSYAFSRTFHSHRTFFFQGKRYRYLIHRYNSSWRSERVVEVPIVWSIVQRSRGRRVLEVGNVLAHYFPVAHDRVDKYERAPGVINQDIVDYRPASPYDLIVSISTLEHVGWDETPRDPAKVLRALDNLARLTAPGGRIVVTLPMAYNPNVDAFLRDGRIAFTERFCLKRVSRDNRWEEVDWPAIQDARSDTPFRRINALVIGVTDPGHPPT